MRTVRVYGATGTGPTPLAAFDRALQVGGVHDTNLIVLSSIIPPDSEVVRKTSHRSEFPVGDRLYCVMAEERCHEPGGEAWAGLAWAIDQGGQGGIFVEAHGRSDHHVSFELEATIEALLADRDYWEPGEVEFEISGIACEGAPVCALVMAVYESAPWLGTPMT